MEKSISLPKKGLGRGLSALIPGAGQPRAETDSEGLSLRVDVDRITPSPFQPRRTFDDAKIEELAASIRNQGIIQPLVVRRKGDG
jgi:ParB family transcriptional regulator, chromosome partitioning protein